MMLKKWMLGEAWGLMSSAYSAWQQLVSTLRRRMQAESLTKMMLRKWEKGDRWGLIVSVFSEWKQLARMSRTMSKGHLSRRSLLELRYLSAWAAVCRDIAQANLFQHMHHDSLGRFSCFALMLSVKGDDLILLAVCFRAYRDEVDQQRFERENAYRMGLEGQLQGLEGQLSVADTQIDQLSDSLQKEMENKEDLLAKLRDAYAQNRSTQASSRPGSTPSSPCRRLDNGTRTGTWPRRPPSTLPTLPAPESPNVHTEVDAEKCTHLDEANWDNAVARIKQ